MRLSRFLSLAVFLSGGAAGAAEPPAAEFFEKHVRPVLAQKCWSCHGPKKQQGGLRLDSRAAVLKGSDGGPVVVAGQPDKSLLLRAVRREGDYPMPPKGHLNETEIEALAAWVRMGVPWPDAAAAVQTSTVEEARRKHWAFRPVQKPALPAVRDAAWVRTPVDAFIRAGLEAKRLSPAPAADRVTLIRRLSFDLTGLPPTPEEVDAFLADPSSAAYEKLVERLLASPHYGERWGRH